MLLLQNLAGEACGFFSHLEFVAASFLPKRTGTGGNDPNMSVGISPCKPELSVVRLACNVKQQLVGGVRVLQEHPLPGVAYRVMKLLSKSHTGGMFNCHGVQHDAVLASTFFDVPCEEICALIGSNDMLVSEIPP